MAQRQFDQSNNYTPNKYQRASDIQKLNENIWNQTENFNTEYAKENSSPDGNQYFNKNQKAVQIHYLNKQLLKKPENIPIEQQKNKNIHQSENNIVENQYKEKKLINDKQTSRDIHELNQQLWKKQSNMYKFLKEQQQQMKIK